MDSEDIYYISDARQFYSLSPTLFIVGQNVVKIQSLQFWAGSSYPNWRSPGSALNLQKTCHRWWRAMWIQHVVAAEAVSVRLRFFHSTGRHQLRSVQALPSHFHLLLLIRDAASFCLEIFSVWCSCNKKTKQNMSLAEVGIFVSIEDSTQLM